MLKKARGQRTKDLNIRLEYLHQAMKSAIEEAQRQQMKLAGKVAAGEEGYRMARDNAQNKVRSLNERYQNKQKELESLGRVKSGLVKYLGTALVCPPPPEITTGGMRNDPEVKALVMNYVMEYERARGWEPEDISQKGDSSGFDIRSIGPIDEVTGNCAIRRIEVKGRANINEEVSLTANEWRRAQQLGDTYWLYVVWGCKTGNLQLLTIQDPAEVLAADVKEVKQVTRYVIGERALRQFSSIE